MVSIYLSFSVIGLGSPASTGGIQNDSPLAVAFLISEVSSS